MSRDYFASKPLYFAWTSHFGALTGQRIIIEMGGENRGQRIKQR